MLFKIYLNQKKSNPHFAEAAKEYIKRLGAYCKTEIRAVEEKKLSHDEKETCSFLLLPGNDSDSSEEFAKRIAQIGISGTSTVCFYLGYSKEVLPNAEILSLSSQDLSVDSAFVLLCEQIYRSYRILNNQPYHK